MTQLHVAYRFRSLDSAEHIRDNSQQFRDVNERKLKCLKLSEFIQGAEPKFAPPIVVRGVQFGAPCTFKSRKTDEGRGFALPENHPTSFDFILLSEKIADFQNMWSRRSAVIERCPSP